MSVAIPVGTPLQLGKYKNPLVAEVFNSETPFPMYTLPLFVIPNLVNEFVCIPIDPEFKIKNPNSSWFLKFAESAATLSDKVLGVSKTPEVTDISPVPEGAIAELPEVPEEPLTPLAPLVPEEPLAPLIPEVPEEPSVPFAPEVPEEPLVPLTPEVPELAEIEVIK
jgi:hypothetical protein